MREHSGLLEETTGPTKVRVRLVDEDSEPLASRRFVVIGRDDKGEGPVAEGITDARGYGAATVMETGWKDLTISFRLRERRKRPADPCWRPTTSCLWIIGIAARDSVTARQSQGPPATCHSGHVGGSGSRCG